MAGVLVIAALGFAAVELAAGDGASSPEGAVEALFRAIDQEDAIGAIEALEPSERRLLMSTVGDLQDEGDRLGLTDPDADLRGVQGVDLEVRDLALRTEDLADGVVAVELSGAVSSATDLRELPLGPVIEGAIERSREDEDGPSSVEERTSDELDLAGGRLVAVRRDGGWHVSLVASVAEAIRRDVEDPVPFPEASDVVPAVGAPDPEAAVRQAIDAATSLDVRRLIELTDPVEAEVLHRYGSLLVDAAADGSSGGSSVEISDLSLTVRDGPDGDRVVSADTITMTTGDEDETYTSRYADGCTEVTWSYSDAYREEYLAEWGDEDADSSWLDGDTYRTCRDDVLGPWAIFGLVESPGMLSVVVTEHDGAWYVRPAATLVETVLDALRALDAEQVQRSVRIWTGEWWLAAPDSFWEACGVARPADDAPVAESREAEARCYEQLPADYDDAEWPYGGMWGPMSGEDEGTLQLLDDGSGPDPGDDLGPEESCYSDAAFASDDPDAAILACLEGLVADGELDQGTVDDFRCSTEAYGALDLGGDELSDEDLEARYQEADDRYEACIAGDGPSSTATTVVGSVTTTEDLGATTTTAGG